MTYRVLIAEDDLCIQRVTELALRRDGFVVTVVSDASDALQVLAGETFDVVILDGMMPKLDGLEACRRIRRNPATRDLPVIILSARSQATDERSAAEAGATAYIKKPFDAPTLGRRVREILESVRVAA